MPVAADSRNDIHMYPVHRDGRPIGKVPRELGIGFLTLATSA